MNLDKIYELLDKIPVTGENQLSIDSIKEDLQEGKYTEALKKIEELSKTRKMEKEKNIKRTKEKETKDEESSIYPDELKNEKLERTYMGILLSNPKLIVKYYFLYDDCLFESNDLLNIYKSVLYTEGGTYTPEVAKNGFSFSKDTEEAFKLKR